MDDIKAFHYQRLKASLRREKSKTSNNTRHSSDAIHKVLQIPELIHLIIEFSSSRSWPSLCVVSKAFAELLKPLIWKHCSFRKCSSIEVKIPYLRKNAHLIHSLDLSELPQSKLFVLLPELSRLNCLGLRSLNLHCAELNTRQLLSLLDTSPQLRSIDITGCIFDLHPLDILSQYSYLDSIAFEQYDPHPLTGPTYQSDLYSFPNLKRLHIVQQSQHTPLKSSRLLPESVPDSFLNLRSLELDRAHGWENSTLQKIISKSPFLSKLCLTECEFSGQIFKSVIASLSSLTSLQLHDCPQILAQDCLNIVQACPRIRILDLMGITIPSDVFELIAKSATHLVSFSIDRSESSYGGVRSIPIYCRKLLHLKIGVMSKSEVPFNSLFEGPSWNCHDLEEFTLEKVHWSSAELRYELVRDHTMETVWRVLASLRKLRVLALKGLDHKKYTYKKKGFRQLETLSFLERLHLSGLGSWEYTDVLWVVETFQWLETFAYAKNELSTPLWAWLRHNRPDLQLIAMD